MLCFLPWCTITDDISVGKFQLMPWGAIRNSGVLPTEVMSAADAVLNAYGRGRKVDQSAVPLVRASTLEWTADLSDAQITDYFEFRSRLAFAVLAKRSFFGHRYANSDNIRLVVQRFTPESDGGAVITSPRRHGSSSNYIPKRALRITRPEHISGWCSLPDDLDAPLLAALEAAYAADIPDFGKVAEAARLFVGASTDSPDIGQHAELLDTVSAFSRLAGAWDDKGTVQAFLDRLPPSGELEIDLVGPKLRPQGPLQEQFPTAKKGQSAKPRSVRETWLRDAYVLRSQYGHGHVDAPRYQSTWTVREHLLLAAIALPLTVKAVLRDAGFYQFTREDVALDDSFDTLATLEPFSLPERTNAEQELLQDTDEVDEDDEDDDAGKRWRAVISRLSLRPMAAALAAAFERDMQKLAGLGGLAE
jgi:hypothetical protein